MPLPFSAHPSRGPPGTHSALVSGFSGSMSLWMALSLLHTSRTLSFPSKWWRSGTLGSCSSPSPGPDHLWRSRTGTGNLTSVEGAGSYRSGSLKSPLRAERGWLSETPLERKIKHIFQDNESEFLVKVLCVLRIWNKTQRTSHLNRQTTPHVTPPSGLFCWPLAQPAPVQHHLLPQGSSYLWLGSYSLKFRSMNEKDLFRTQCRVIDDCHWRWHWTWWSLKF